MFVSALRDSKILPLMPLNPELAKLEFGIAQKVVLCIPAFQIGGSKNEQSAPSSLLNPLNDYSQHLVNIQDINVHKVSFAHIIITEACKQNRYAVIRGHYYVSYIK